MWDILCYDATIATCAESNTGYGLLTHAGIAIKEGKIVWLGQISELTSDLKTLAKKVIAANGLTITPGLIDCHTHLVYAGNRASEFAQRLHGATYQQIAEQGGGIHATVKATQEANFDSLYEQSSLRLKQLMQNGVTTVEIKSGYGLKAEHEVKQLKVAKKLAEKFPITIVSTFLAAHVLPVEYKDRSDDYITYMCEEVLSQIASEQLATAVDAFCEKIAFTPAQVERIFIKAQEYGLAIKLHAEQLSNSNGAQLAAKYHALSADHLEHITESGIDVMAKAGVTAVLLPGAYYFLREIKQPPIELFRAYQVPIAIATDCNPGTSPTTSLTLMMNMAAVLWRMTPEETLRGATIHAAKALGLHKTHGSLEVNKVADLVGWRINHPDELTYNIGNIRPEFVIKNGTLL
ncbi:MAG: imidazolonepropionase [Gammaproteobacteria bacterium]